MSTFHSDHEHPTHHNLDDRYQLPQQTYDRKTKRTDIFFRFSIYCTSCRFFPKCTLYMCRRCRRCCCLRCQSICRNQTSSCADHAIVHRHRTDHNRLTASFFDDVIVLFVTIIVIVVVGNNVQQRHSEMTKSVRFQRRCSDDTVCNLFLIVITQNNSEKYRIQ